LNTHAYLSVQADHGYAVIYQRKIATTTNLN